MIQAMIQGMIQICVGYLISCVLVTGVIFLAMIQPMIQPMIQKRELPRFIFWTQSFWYYPYIEKAPVWRLSLYLDSLVG